MLRTRLRGAKPTAYPHYRMVLLTNPGVPTHHLRTAEGLRMAYSTHQDNPALWDGTTWTSEGERRSEEHTSELQSLMRISYAVFCLKKKNTKKTQDNTMNIHTHRERELRKTHSTILIQT